eukprot:c21373_g1_i1.p1 GENE.c21373_g1_i1~~c21373_g1_i1.p1  ORF type:complete len:318 (-),score=49.98 c21373_g1_i1:75-983(-)
MFAGKRSEAEAASESIQSLKDRCASMMGDACRLLALSMIQGAEAEKEIPAALELLEKACELDDHEGCHYAGALRAAGVGIASAPELAFAHFVRGCNIGGGPSCTMAAKFAGAGVGTEKDPAQAAELLNKGCALNDGPACLGLSVMIERAPELFSDVDDAEAKALEYTRKACELDVPLACFMLGLRMRSGVGAPKDELRAAAMFGRACKLSYVPGCYELGVSYAVGTGVSKDAVLAAKYFRLACENGSPEGCLNFAAALNNGEGVPHNPKAAQMIYQRAVALREQAEKANAANAGAGAAVTHK